MEFLEGVSDPWLKPRLLRSLVHDRLPDDARPLPNATELASVLDGVKNHGLLTERLPGGPSTSDAKLMDAWRSAVDAWVDRVLSLASSQMPDKCWVGLCLLGVTCEECSSERLNASYSLWFQKLLSSIQQPSSSVFTKVASCTSLSDFFIRLASCPNVRKDATSFAGKVIQPILHFLNEDRSEAVQEGAADLLCTVMTFFPCAIQRHYDNVEALLVSKILPAQGNGRLSKKLACCLALLPKVRGDEDSWSLMMQRIVIEIDILLNDAFQGLEEETKHSKLSRLFVSPGRDPPPTLGVFSRVAETSEHPIKRLRELIIPMVSVLMQCCSMMLTNPYPVQVTAPIRALVALVGRILEVDASLPKSLMPLTTVMQQELLCYELPSLHLECLDLLIAIIKGVRSQLLPHAANIVRILTEYFRRATFASTRIKLYSIMQALLISMGVGMALYLAQEVINNAYADLNDMTESSSLLPNRYTSNVVSQTLIQGGPRKRKHSSASVQHANGVDPETAAISLKPASPLSVKIAALKALEALLTVGGSLRSECWRSNVDSLLISVARNACYVGWAYEGKSLVRKDDSTSSRADFQLASLKALLASLLSTSHVRPPHLSEGLELFHRGKLESGTELAAFCSHALLALEVLIHPRALPLVDFPAPNSSSFDEGLRSRYHESGSHSSQKSKLPFCTGGRSGMNDMEDDDMYYGWLDAAEEEQTLHGSMDKSVPENQGRANSDRGHQTVTHEPPGNFDAEIAAVSKDEHVVSSSNLEEPHSINVTICNKTSPAKGDILADILSRDEKAPENIDANTFNTNAGDSISDIIPTDGRVVTDLTADADDISQSLHISDKGKGPVSSNHSDSDADSVPEIEFRDPDTDSD